MIRRVPRGLSLAVILLVLGTAAVPRQVAIQGRLTDASGVPLLAGRHAFAFAIYSGAGALVWPGNPSGEPQSIACDANGLWSAQLGAVDPLTDAVFSDSARWLEVMVDGTTLPRVKLLTGPYAFRVSAVDGASGGKITSKLSIGPGHSNTGSNAFVAGESNNASGDNAAIGGGWVNIASGELSTVAGGHANSATGGSATVAGGTSNTAGNSGATVAGGGHNVAGGYASTVGGGYADSAAGDFSAISGGQSNRADGNHTTIGGGRSNSVAGQHGTVGGGGLNTASGQYATIGGGGFNTASGDSSVVSGGSSNRATGLFAVIGGGVQNWAAGGGATIAGGGGNSAGGGWATVGGGAGNNATYTYSVVAGGRINTASGYISTVGGGDVNTASAHYATVPGGFENVASGSFSFAAGGRAHASHTNTFVWASGNIQRPPFGSTGVDQFLVNAPGGVGLGTNAPQQQLSVAGGMNIDQGNTNTGDVTNSFRFGSSSGEAIASKRTTGGNQFGLDFYTQSTNRMSITNAGHVGIGTATPAQTLQVGDEDVVGAQGMIRLESRSSTGSLDRRIWEIGVPQTGAVINGKGYDFVIDDIGVGVEPEAIVQWGTGYLGLAVTDPAFRLELPNVANNSGQGRANAWVTYSSRRWKKNIRTLSDAVDKVCQLRGVEYDNVADNGHAIGLIAEEVGVVIPEVVQYEANGVDAAALDYGRLVALLIEGMKEQQRQIDELKAALRARTP